MNASQVIAAHREWKEHFRIAMATREPFDLKQVASDCCCEFGHWLHSEAKKTFGHLPAYTKCVAQHALFHEEAARIAALINDGKLLEAEKMIAQGTPYARASENMGIAVIEMLNTQHAPAQNDHTLFFRLAG